MVNYTANLKKRTLEPSELPSDVNYKAEWAKDF